MRLNVSGFVAAGAESSKRVIGRVLVVDDDPDEADLIALAFKISGYPVDVVVASNGRQALQDLIGPERIPFDLVLFNLDSAAPNGVEVLRRIGGDRALGCWAPRVGLASIVEADRLQDWYQLGVTS